MTIHIDFPDGSFQLFAGVLLICVAYFGYLFECLIEEKKIRFWDLNGNAKAKILGILTGAAYLIINGLIKVIK